TLTIQEDSDLAAVQFSSAGYSVSETSGTATVSVNLSPSSNQTVTVHYQTSDGSGKAGTDYTSVSGTLTFNPGVTVKTFTIPILDDNAVNEPNETVNLILSNPSSNASLGSPSSAVLTINEDNDNTNSITVEFNTSSYSTSETSSTATITAVLNKSSTQTVTVQYQTS